MQFKFFFILLVGWLGMLMPCGMFGQSVDYGLEGANWYFGYNSGIRFEGDSVYALTDGQLAREEGCATVSDKYGNLLFYTDGVDVWNRQHQIMLNGAGITNFRDNTQCLIAPLPGSDSIFYIFTTMDQEPNPSMGFGYHLVDMAGDNGLGEVISRGSTLFSPASEGVCMTRAANGSDLWILGHGSRNNVFRAYRLTCHGLDTNAVISAAGLPDLYGAGYMKFSHDGQKVAFVEYWQDSVTIVDFDLAMAMVNNPIFLEGLYRSYGIEFSPNNSKLYVSQLDTNPELFQFDLSSGNEQLINGSRISIPLPFGPIPGGVQLGIDGKIYTNNIGRNFLSIIEHPDSSFPGCGYVPEGIFYTSTGATSSGSGLPHLFPPPPKTNFTHKPDSQVCEGDYRTYSLTFSHPPDSVNWLIVNPETNDSIAESGDSVVMSFPNAGNYDSRTISYWGCETDTLFFNLAVISPPILELPDTVFQCGYESVNFGPTLMEGATSFLWSNFDTTAQIEVVNPGNYSLEVRNICGNAFGETYVKMDQDSGLFLPNVFTPNGDGINDVWGIEVRNPSDFFLQVFDRWGKRVFQSQTIETQWDGVGFPTGVYFYLMNALDCKNERIQRKGSISLLR